MFRYTCFLMTILCVFVTANIQPSPVHAQRRVNLIQVPVRQSIIKGCRQRGASITKLIGGDQSIVRITKNPKYLVFFGKKFGVTNVTIKCSRGGLEKYTVEITYPLSRLNHALKTALDESSEVTAKQAGNILILSGNVSTSEEAALAEKIAIGVIAPYKEADPILENTIRVTTSQQVQLEITFAEVSRSALRNIGLSFWGKQTQISGGVLSPQSNALSVQDPSFDLPSTAQLNAATPENPFLHDPLKILPGNSSTFATIFTTNFSNFPFAATLSLLSNRGFSRILAEPTLVAMSGHRASFLAGGEVPIPASGSLGGGQSIQYKPYGIQLNFTPVVINETIHLSLETTSSDLTATGGVTVAGSTLPGFATRSAQTSIRLLNGQSFVIAGLLSDTIGSNVNKFPGLSEIPFLGALFRSSQYRRTETELLIVVTANLVEPLSGMPKLPGHDKGADPSDIELFILGLTEARFHEEQDPENDAVFLENEPPSELQKPAGPVGFKR